MSPPKNKIWRPSKRHLWTTIVALVLVLCIYYQDYITKRFKQLHVKAVPSFPVNAAKENLLRALESPSSNQFFNSSDVKSPKSQKHYDVWKNSWWGKHLVSSLNHQLEMMAPFVPVNVGFIKTKNLARVKQWQQSYRNNRQKFITDILRSGFGLKTYETERGEDAWTENGVVFRPHRAPEVTPKYPSPYKPEVEPYIPFDPKTFFESQPHSNEKKIILWHTKTRYWPVINNLRALRACPEFPCVITTNRQYTKTSSAMVFAAQLITGKPPGRRPEQMFILHNHEPETPDWVTRSVDTIDKFGWNKAFNWTMTYRFDSDIVTLYGIVRRRKVPKERDYHPIVANKTKMVAWMVSHCETHGQREKYVKELSKHIPVDIYGACGPFKCRRSSDSECFQMIDRTYKFYLSFENAMCTDYISEKFFRYFQNTMIPVVRGDNKYFRHAPPETFLNTADFSSPKALAARMWELARNENELIRMLQEKDKYILVHEDYPIRSASGEIRYMTYHYEAVPFCEMCQKLWNIDRYGKTLPSAKRWLNKEMCYHPKDV